MRGFVALLLVWGSGWGAFAAETPATLRNRFETGQPTRIVCFGDSITGAYYHTGGTRAWCDMLGMALERLYPHAQVEMINAGISGHTTQQGLARLEKDVLARQPHLVVVKFGMNDVARLPLEEFAKNLKTIVEKCQAGGAAVVLCTPNTVYENNDRAIAKLATLSQTSKAIAEELQVPLADLFAATEQDRAENPSAWMLTMSDDIHPNLHGHRRLAAVMAETIAGRPVKLDFVPPLADSLHQTLSLLEAGKPVHLVAMPPYDRLMADALKKKYPDAQLQVTTWPIENQSLAQLGEWANQVRGLKPNLVVPAIPPSVLTGDVQHDVLGCEKVLNRCFPFAGRAWDVVPIQPRVANPDGAMAPQALWLSREMAAGKDLRSIDRLAGDQRSVEDLLTAWIQEQDETRWPRWPELPLENATVSIPAQEWRFRPGPRRVDVRVHYPQGSVKNLTADTGLMLTLHNWGGEYCIGTADPQQLADRLNVVALCVNYCQSGRQDSIDGPEPYDFGYLQATDALRALWWIKTALRHENHPFAAGRVFATGGSGGGNVTLMSNKLAPRTFAAIVDMCGMKKLSDDIAFNLPGGSPLNARWQQDGSSPYYLSPDAQELRYVGHPGHLSQMQQLGHQTQVVVVHGTDDATCPFPDAEEMAAAMKAAGISLDTYFLKKEDLDGKIFRSTGHALGDRTEIVFRTGGDYLTVTGEKARRRVGKDDFDRRDELVRYATPNGTWVISYAAGFPVGRFEPNVSGAQ